jgi:hypothetical protein
MNFLLNQTNIISEKPIPFLIEGGEIKDYAKKAFDDVKGNNNKMFKYCIFHIHELKKIFTNSNAKFISFIFSNYTDSIGLVPRTLIAIALDENGNYIGTAENSFYSIETPKQLNLTNDVQSLRKINIVLKTEEDTKWYWPTDFDPSLPSEVNFLNWKKSLKIEEAIRNYPDPIIIDENGSRETPERIEVFFPIDWLSNDFNILNYRKIALIPIILYAEKTFRTGLKVEDNFVTFSILPVNTYNELEKFSGTDNIPTSGIAYPPRWKNLGLNVVDNGSL